MIRANHPNAVPAKKGALQTMKIVALVLAGGEGTRLYPLTAEQAKPALPFAGGFRIVDFVLSNLVNSGISTIYVLAQYKPESLIAHITTAWAPAFSGGRGMIKVLLPRANTLGGRFKGTADAVYQYLDLLRAHAPDRVAGLIQCPGQLAPAQSAAVIRVLIPDDDTGEPVDVA